MDDTSGIVAGLRRRTRRCRDRQPDHAGLRDRLAGRAGHPAEHHHRQHRRHGPHRGRPPERDERPDRPGHPQPLGRTVRGPSRGAPPQPRPAGTGRPPEAVREHGHGRHPPAHRRPPCHRGGRHARPRADVATVLEQEAASIVDDAFVLQKQLVVLAAPPSVLRSSSCSPAGRSPTRCGPHPPGLDHGHRPPAERRPACSTPRSATTWWCPRCRRSRSRRETRWPTSPPP